MSVWRDNQGATAMVVALAISVVIGFGALGIEGSMWYAQSRNVHMAADTAALTGAVTYAAGDTTNFATEAKAIAATYGYVNNVGGVTVAVNHPPLTGPNTANQSAVEVIITTPQTPMISRLLHSANLTLYGRAVGAAGNSTPACVLTLDTVNEISTTIDGNTINFNGCGVAINSPNSKSIDLKGGSLTTAEVSTVGGIGFDGGALTAPIQHTSAAATTDPYAGKVSIPSYSGCGGGTNVTINGNASVGSAGTTTVYCSGLDIKSGNVTLAGTIIMDRGTFVIEGGTVTTAAGGATIILTSSTASGYAQLDIRSSADVTLTAPTTGTNAGIAIYADKNSPHTNTVTTEGGSTVNVTGAIYAPSELVDFEANFNQGSPACTQVIAYQVKYHGGANMNNNCTGTGTTAIGIVQSKLVE